MYSVVLKGTSEKFKIFPTLIIELYIHNVKTKLKCDLATGMFYTTVNILFQNQFLFYFSYNLVGI